ncbi:MAG: 2Fe-2S iron-sulfur cluster-binding protein [Treponema sp.]|nr:2Fe-2S iron-sulfur cluster-binding protein [Treponema sp.]
MKIIIDGKTCEAEAGQFLREVARQNGIEIPSLCHHSALPGQACCRLCIVEVEDPGGARSVVVSCVYPVKESITVHTRSEKIIRLRRDILALLKERAPAFEGTLAEYCSEYGVSGCNLRFNVKKDEKCILCGLCVKACEEMGTSAIQTVMRGIHKLVSTPFNEPSSVCIGCASCARVCPADAIEWSNDGDKRAIWGKTFTLLKCASCREPYATEDELKWLKGRLIDTELNLEYCPKCRGRASLKR